MAQEVVVKDQLTESMVEWGRLLAAQLLKADLDLVCAMWRFDLESNLWRFVFSSPRVDSDGPLHVYETVQGILKSATFQGSGLRLQNISVLTPADPLIRAIRSAFKVDADRTEIRLTRNRIKDVFVEDAMLLYVR